MSAVNLPNIISLGRLFAVPIVVWLIIDHQMALAFWLFVAAGISDAVDGLIAKHFDAESEFGRFLDPLADKALLVSVYISLGHGGYLETWLVILVVFRDIMIVGGAILFQALTLSLKMRPLLISKVNTTTQIVLAAVVLGGTGLEFDIVWLIEPLVYLVAATTLASGAAYVVTWTRRAAVMED